MVKKRDKLREKSNVADWQAGMPSLVARLVSHEVNNPLAVLRAWLFLLKDDSTQIPKMADADIGKHNPYLFLFFG